MQNKAFDDDWTFASATESSNPAATGADVFALETAEDEELRELFAAFDDVTAGDEAIEAALSAIAAARLAEEPARSTEPARADNTSNVKPFRKRAKLRLARIAATAACIAAIGAGTAYAYPVSHVSLTCGDSTIELGFNVFDVNVSAEASSEKGRVLLVLANVRNKHRADALKEIARADAEQDEPLFGTDTDIEANAPTSAKREELEREAKQLFDETKHDTGTAERDTDKAENDAGAKEREDKSAERAGKTSERNGATDERDNETDQLARPEKRQDTRNDSVRHKTGGKVEEARATHDGAATDEAPARQDNTPSDRDDAHGETSAKK